MCNPVLETSHTWPVQFQPIHPSMFSRRAAKCSGWYAGPIQGAHYFSAVIGSSVLEALPSQGLFVCFKGWSYFQEKLQSCNRQMVDCQFVSIRSYFFQKDMVLSSLLYSTEEDWGAQCARLNMSKDAFALPFLLMYAICHCQEWWRMPALSRPGRQRPFVLEKVTRSIYIWAAFCLPFAELRLPPEVHKRQTLSWPIWSPNTALMPYWFVLCYPLNNEFSDTTGVKRLRKATLKLAVLQSWVQFTHFTALTAWREKTFSVQQPSQPP